MRKIAFWQTVGAAHSFVFTNPGLLLRLFWPAFGILIVLIPVFFHRVLSLFVASAVFLMAAAVMGGLAFNRAALLDERNWLAIRFLWPHWRFLGVSIVIALIMALPPLILSPIILGFLVDHMRVGLSPMTIIFVGWSGIVLIQLLLWSAVGRLMLALPAIALGEGSGLFERAWRRSRGNVLRLFLGSALCWIPLQLLPEVVIRLYYLVRYYGKARTLEDVGLSTALLSLGVHGIVSLLSTCLAMAFYAYSYAQLAQLDLAQTLTTARAARRRSPASMPETTSLI